MRGVRAYTGLFSEVSDLRKLWPAYGVSALGDAAQFTAILWLASRDEQAGFAVAIVVLALTAPSVLFGPWLGAVPDFLDNRRPVLVFADVLRAALAAAIPLAFSLAGLGGLLPLAVLMGGLSVVFGSSYRAALPEIVSHDRLARVNGLLATTGQLAYLAGAVLGGVLIEAASIHVPFWLNAATFLVSALLIAAVKREKFTVEHDASRAGRKSYFAALAEGYRWIARDRRVRTLFLIGFIATIGFAPSPVALVVLTKDVLGGGAAWFGLLQAFMMAGLAVGSLVGGALKRASLAVGMSLGWLAMGIGTLGLGLSTALWMAAMFALARSAMNGAAVVLETTLLQQVTPNEVRGRIAAIASATSEIPRVAILPVAGALVDGFGPRIVYMLMALFIAGAGGLGLLHRRRLEGEPEAVKAESSVASPESASTLVREPL